jgi:hypothetical protein
MSCATAVMPIHTRQHRAIACRKLTAGSLRIARCGQPFAAVRLRDIAQHLTMYLSRFAAVPRCPHRRSISTITTSTIRHAIPIADSDLISSTSRSVGRSCNTDCLSCSTQLLIAALIFTAAVVPKYHLVCAQVTSAVKCITYTSGACVTHTLASHGVHTPASQSAGTIGGISFTPRHCP